MVVEFRMGREREGPKLFLEKFDGLLQSDGYAVYDSVAGPKMVHAACWLHARIKFIEVVKVHPCDAPVRRAKLDHAARHTLRNKKAPALLEEIKAAKTGSTSADSKPDAK